MNEENPKTQDELQLEALVERLPNADEEVLQRLLDDSKSIALNNLFPYEEILPEELPKKYLNWQLRVSEYMYKHADTIGIKQYSENGITITFTSDNIPKSFMNELVPYAGAIWCKPRKHPIGYKEETDDGI